jgi:hypothetical protein
VGHPSDQAVHWSSELSVSHDTFYSQLLSASYAPLMP